MSGYLFPSDIPECLNELTNAGGLVEDWLKKYTDDEKEMKTLLMRFLRQLSLPENRQYQEEFELIREFGERTHQILAEDALYKQAISGEKNHFKAVQTLLERRAPGRWSKIAEKKSEQIKPEELQRLEEELLNGQ